MGTFSWQFPQGSGGAIWADGSTVNIYNSTLQNNEATAKGYCYSGSDQGQACTRDSECSGLRCQGGSGGGAISIDSSSTVNIYNSMLQNNEAAVRTRDLLQFLILVGIFFHLPPPGHGNFSLGNFHSKEVPLGLINRR